MKYFFLSIIILYGGCINSSTPKAVDTKKIHLTTIHWGADDLEEIAQKIVSSILSTSKIDFSKTYHFGKIRNDSHDHIDTKLLTNKITTALVKSNIVKISESYNSQNGGIFYGKISSIFKKTRTTKDMFFTFNLSLTDTTTSQVVWSEDIEIRKEYKKELIGW